MRDRPNVHCPFMGNYDPKRGNYKSESDDVICSFVLLHSSLLRIKKVQNILYGLLVEGMKRSTLFIRPLDYKYGESIRPEIKIRNIRKFKFCASVTSSSASSGSVFASRVVKAINYLVWLLISSI